MVVSELAARLNCAEYKNWVKAGHCLLLLRSCLQGFIDREVLSFHRGLLAAVPGLGPHATCRGGSRCSPRARQPQCQVCAEWKHEILRHHINRNGDVHWGNCKPGLWPKDPWEVAKAFMPRGLADKRGPEECDAVALLSLINSCDHFVVDRKKVTEVIKCRNEIMHSSEMKVSSTWLRDFQIKIQNFLNEFKNIPEIVAVYSRIEQISNQLDVVKGFLGSNTDLRNGLTEDLQKLESLHLQHQKQTSKDAGRQTPERKA
ncbi:RIKEN cDNA 1810030O07 [Mus musculus]|nr:RIKEN cDNA 1810030O07 [Mus musculus]